MITLVWDWFSFFAGVIATISLGFWLLVWFAFKQWKNNKKLQESSFEKLMAEWGNKK